MTSPVKTLSLSPEEAHYDDPDYDPPKCRWRIETAPESYEVVG